MPHIRSARRWRPLLVMVLVALFSGCEAGDKHAFDPANMKLPAADIYSRALERLRAGDMQAALPLPDEAAGKGNAQAKYQLGLLDARGEDVQRDMDKAREFLLAAAKLGHAKAQYHLGHMYGTADGVERDYQEAFVWFWLAASYGDNNAKRYMRVVLPKLTPAQYGDAEARMKHLWDQMPPESKKDMPVQTSVMH